MRVRVISSREEIETINPKEKIVHMSFRASNMDFVKLMKRCPGLRAIQIPPSYIRTMSTAIKGFLEMQGIELLAGDVWGHRKDIDEYFAVPETAMEKIKDLRQKGFNAQEMTSEVQKDARLGEDLIRFIVRTAVAA